MIEDNAVFDALWRRGRADAEACRPCSTMVDPDENAVYAAGYHNDPGMLMAAEYPAVGADDASAPAPPLIFERPQDERLDRMRAQLIEMISGASESRWAAGWDVGISRELLNEGGLWEVLGRAVGWPVGVDGEEGWATWDEARAAAGLEGPTRV